jgi:putative restriction endonuclease
VKEGQTLWTRDELILAVNLYCKLTFGQMHHNNLDVIHLANLIGRSPGAVARKLGNFASFDVSLKQRGIGGLPNAGKLDRIIWDEFYDNWEDRAFESEKLLAKYEDKPVEALIDLSDVEIREGKEKERLVKTRVNQSFFRSMILASYNFSCCITGIQTTGLLVGSHIVPWAADKDNRLNPRNGLCLNALHDRAFDLHLFTIQPDLKIVLSKRLKKEKKKNKFMDENFFRFESKQIIKPRRFLPDEKFLLLHNEEFDRRNV